MADHKYYWLKLKRDFFKRHDIRIIEEMENGEKYLLFYLKLLVESIDHDGSLRFSDTIPYNDKMLSTITNTDIDIVRSAVKVFSELGMMEQLDDGTLYMSQVKSMVGDETLWAEKKRIYRSKKTLQIDGQKKTLSDKSKSIDIEKEIDKELDNIKKFVPPTLQELTAYQQEKAQSVDVNTFLEYYSSENWIDKNGNPVKNWKLKMLTWHNKRVAEGWKPPAVPKEPVFLELPEEYLKNYYGEGKHE